MNCNMGTADRWARVVLGLSIGFAGLYFERLWGLFGLVPLATALVGWCPAYVPFGFSTRARRSGRSLQ